MAKYPSIRNLIRQLGTLILLGVLAVIIILVFYNVKKKSEDFHFLIENQMPIFNEINKLSQDLSLVTPILYSYYVTADSKLFEKKYHKHILVIKNNFENLNKEMPNSQELQKVKYHFNELLRISDAFITTMRQSPVNWNQARSVLSLLALADDKLYKGSSELTQSLQKRMALNFTLAMNYINEILITITFFSFLLLIAIVILIKLNKYRLEAMTKQQIHLDFPIKNPTPVMALDASGKILFANPAATKWALKFGLSSPASLLPLNIDERLTEKKKVSEWEYDNGLAILKIRLLWLDSHERYHLYLDDLSELKKAENKIIKRALTNELTALPNRACFNLDASSGKNETKAFALLNVSDFQRVINTAGQNVIDRVVIKAANLINDCLDSQLGQLYRFDGNLFGIRFKTDKTGGILHSIIRSFDAPLKTEGFDFYFTLNIGLVDCFGNDYSADELLMKAGTALDFSRDIKGQTVQLYEPSIEENIQKQMALENDLHKALAKNELKVFFQPKVDTKTRKFVSSEALLRWQRNGEEWISPFEFIPIAEKTGLIIAIGDWVLKTACQNAKEWNAHSREKVSVAVNVSSIQFIHGDLFNSVKSALASTGLDAECLQLEITESVTLHDIDFVINELHKLRKLGVTIALDDFGTGFSSLTYLNALPIDYVKIDQSFIRRILLSKQDADISHSIIKLAHDLGLFVIAEGVEDEGQYELLNKWHCDQIQGYLFAKPMPYNDFCTALGMSE